MNGARCSLQTSPPPKLMKASRVRLERAFPGTYSIARGPLTRTGIVGLTTMSATHPPSSLQIPEYNESDKMMQPLMILMNIAPRVRYKSLSNINITTERLTDGDTPMPHKHHHPSDNDHWATTTGNNHPNSAHVCLEEEENIDRFVGNGTSLMTMIRFSQLTN
jgi:hypothetical protein